MMPPDEIAAVMPVAEADSVAADSVVADSEDLAVA